MGDEKIPCALIVMGVSGSGKSTIAGALAKRLGWRFEDGEIRGRKLTDKIEPRVVKARLVERDGALVFEAPGVEIDPEAIAQAVAEERESQ